MTDKLRPFAGVDGEGCGRNRLGQQHYMLLGASGVAPLYTGKPLSTLECLDWICDLPPDPINVGFAFGYDTSQILRDLPAGRLFNKSGTGLFNDKEGGKGHSRYTYFENFGLSYIPKNYLRVCRIKRGRRRENGVWVPTRRRVEGSTRTIYETFGFFQASFLKALEQFSIGREHWPMIARNKEARADFVRITREIRRYNQLECELLAELMERFREVCHDCDLRPATWNGAGKIAAAEHRKHHTPTRQQVVDCVPDGVLSMALAAYYGGRFEVTRIGQVAGPIWEYDIGSAYPSAMRSLPCLLHGEWEAFTGKPPKSLHVAYVAFSHGKSAPLCGLPIRQDDGRLFWPRQGQGVYWSVELDAAKRLGTKLRYTAGWRYVCRCQCQPFDWIEHRYRQRQALGKNAAGYPIKLALNSLYGKLAQRIGNPRYANPIWAGLITATTRAALNDAARQAPGDIVMLATDALFSKSRLTLSEGADLGQWEASEHERLFVCQPGVYWGASRPKTRGVSVPPSVLAKHIRRFERAWRTWAKLIADPARPPKVSIPLPLFIGLRLAWSRERGAIERGERDRLATVCRWDMAPREFSFDWSGKRAASIAAWDGLGVVTRPADGAPDLVSVPHDRNTAWDRLNEERMRLDDQPDLVDLTPPR
jgi:hypothetical protein